jgi:hypothetical protein
MTAVDCAQAVERGLDARLSHPEGELRDGRDLLADQLLEGCQSQGHPLRLERGGVASDGQEELDRSSSIG